MNTLYVELYPLRGTVMYINHINTSLLIYKYNIRQMHDRLHDTVQKWKYTRYDIN